MADPVTPSLSSFKTRGEHSVSGLSSGAFMTVQLSIAHSSRFVGAGVIAGGPYRSAETFPHAAPTVPMSCILNSLYVAMTPLTEATAPDVDRLLRLARDTQKIDGLENVAKQRLYIFTGTADAVVNQLVVKTTRTFYDRLGVTGDAMKFVDDVPAGHSIVTSNPEDSPISDNRPPYINNGGFMQSHDILNHIYPDLKAPVKPKGELIRFDQSEFTADAPDHASMSPFAYVYVPSSVADGTQARGVHIVLHGCKQGYDFQDFLGGVRNRNVPPYGARYMTTTGYMEMAEANDLLLLFPQIGGSDDTILQNPDGCWDWWGYTAPDPQVPDYYSQDAVQIRAIAAMLDRLAGK